LSKTFSDVSWLASLDYEIASDTLVYVKAARGARAGGQQGRANGNNPASYIPFDPEVVTEYEGGLKTQLFDRRVTLNIAGFYDDFTGVQRSVTLLTPTGTTTNVSNAAAARLYGIEGEANVRVTDQLRVGGNLGYLNPKYKRFDDALLGDRSREAWPAPKWTYALNAHYQVPVSVGSVEANATWTFTGNQNLQPQAAALSQVTQKGYGLLAGTATLHLEHGELDIGLWGRNLTNKKYYVTGTSTETVGFNQLYTGEPRTYGVQVTKRFGAL
jgi:iron complex outermembrane receptor protein